MSICLALSSNRGAVVASDSRLADTNGVPHADYDKTFDVKGSIIGAFCGVLRFRGRIGVEVHARDALAGSKVGLDHNADVLAEHLKKRLLETDAAEVGFAHRRVEVLLAVKAQPGIRAIQLKPNADRTAIDVVVSRFTTWATTGDDLARASITERLKAIDFTGHTTQELAALASSLIEEAIKASGPHPTWPAIKSCAGVPRTRSVKYPSKA